MASLHCPIGIFDAGIGSYAIVERVHRAFATQDILYLADRASFPYGAKSAAQLLASTARATAWLAQQGCRAVILASNAPSIMVLDALRAQASVPVIGIFPPVQAALAASHSGRVAVLGVKSMVDSAPMAAYVQANQGGRGEVLLANASAMVALVEDFSFLSDPVRTQTLVDGFVAELLARAPGIDVMTLSSTHLPWLQPFFERAAPQVRFLDPADSVLDQVGPFASAGTGQVRAVATETAQYPLDEFNHALRQIGFAGVATRVVF